MREESRPRNRKRPVIFGACLLALLVGFCASVHPFLAINEPVPADTLVVEGWVPTYVLDRAAAEALRGGYAHVFVSGIGSDAIEAANDLVARGLPADRVIAAPTDHNGFNRTPWMSRAVREKMTEAGWRPKGINVITLGPHARQSRLAYRRMFAEHGAVGVISVPKDDYDPDRWWLYAAGIKKTLKDFAGWAKELVFGLRS